jgi:carbon monoxide dehydrogenase subunit G
MVASVGPVKARFSGSLTLSNVLAPNAYTLTFEGSGGAVGFGKGSADVALSVVDGGTLLAYQTKVQVGGKLAQVGSRLISGVAEKMATEFFTRFQAHLMSAELAQNALMPHLNELVEVSADESLKAVGPSRWKFWVRT